MTYELPLCHTITGGANTKPFLNAYLELTAINQGTLNLPVLTSITAKAEAPKNAPSSPPIRKPVLPAIVAADLPELTHDTAAKLTRNPTATQRRRMTLRSALLSILCAYLLQTIAEAAHSLPLNAGWSLCAIAILPGFPMADPNYAPVFCHSFCH